MSNALNGNEEIQNRNMKVLAFLVLVWGAFCVLGIRLFYLQYVHYEDNFARSENNRIRRMEIDAERGFIFDRNGKVLVRNRPSYQIVL